MVTGFLTLLSRDYGDRLDDKAGEYISYAVDGSKRMSALISDLLAYSRVDRSDREIAPASAEAALRSALANLKSSIEEAGALLTQDELPTLPADATQLALLFQNLVGNAVKFRAEGRPCRIHVGACRGGGDWILSVRDNGIGIPEEYYERVFVLFQRLHSRERYEGTGIGLAICKRIVERHGGRIWVESRPGEGATFFFTWPADPAHS